MSKKEINTAINIINIINIARENAFRHVNEELINMYWHIGEYLHFESKKVSFGDSFIDATKNNKIVEYSLNRTLSPMMVAEYKLQLPDKEVLQRKLQELINIPLIEEQH